MSAERQACDEKGASKFGCPALGFGVAEGAAPKVAAPKATNKTVGEATAKRGIQKVDPPHVRAGAHA